MQHPHDGDRLSSGVIHDQVGKYRPEFHRQRCQVLAKVSDSRSGGQQAEGSGDVLQYISGEAAAALAYEVVPDFAQVVPRLGGEDVARHSARTLRLVEFREQLGHNALTIEALALPQGFETLGDLGMHLVLAKPAALRQIPLDGLTHQLSRLAVLFRGGRLYFRKQAGGNQGIGRKSWYSSYEG